MSADLTDEQLVQRVRAGDWESYGILAARHRQKLHRVAQRFARDSSEIEDVVQTAHVLALRKFHQFQGGSAYFQWMASIAINEIRTRHRQNRLPVSYGQIPDITPAVIPNPEQAANYQEMRRMLARALGQMAPAYRRVFRLRALAEFSTAETGRRLGITEACVKTRLRRARLMLRDILEATSSTDRPEKEPNRWPRPVRRHAPPFLPSRTGPAVLTAEPVRSCPA
jgi:RNA polymerase sigma-70 factor (ECF subfamily)